MASFIALYDACVLYPAPLRDVLMQMALTDLYQAKWSHMIHDEWMRNLLRNRPDLTRERLERTRERMDSHTRDCLVIGFEDLIDTDVAMSEALELVRGSDNPFEDVGLQEANTKLIKADLAAEIIVILRERRLTGAAAAKLASVQTKDISRIRHTDLSRFTIDRLVTILNRLNRHVEVRLTVRAAPAEHSAPVFS